MLRRRQDNAPAAHSDAAAPTASSRLAVHFPGARAHVVRLYRRAVIFAREHPLMAAAMVVLVGATGGYIAAAIAGNKRGDILFTASTTLLFAGLIGGVVKLLLDDVQRERARREEELGRDRALRSEQTRFIAAALADLESVYDRVERVRILVEAHRSALTYGKEMRDLIDATVQLRNVTRALDADTSGIPADRLKQIIDGVRTMERYLEALVDEFTASYKAISDKQRVHEAAFEASLAAAAKTEDREAGFNAVKVPDNAAWSDIEGLIALKEFRRARPQDADDAPGRADSTGSGNAEFDYRRDFVETLDDVSRRLQVEMWRLANA